MKTVLKFLPWVVGGLVIGFWVGWLTADLVVTASGWR